MWIFPRLLSTRNMTLQIVSPNLVLKTTTIFSINVILQFPSIFFQNNLTTILTLISQCHWTHEIKPLPPFLMPYAMLMCSVLCIFMWYVFAYSGKSCVKYDTVSAGFSVSIPSFWLCIQHADAFAKFRSGLPYFGAARRCM